MLSQSTVFTETYKVRSYNTDSRGNLSPISLCHFLLDAAGRHAHELGLSVKHLMTEHSTWVLSKFVVQMNEYPFYGDTLTISTWPSGIKRLYAMRDFRIEDTRGRILGSATTAWLIINILNRRPLKPKPILETLNISGFETMQTDIFDKLPELDCHEYEQRFRVRNSDIDLNNHVTSVSYIGWAIESVPHKIHETHLLKNMEIMYLAETLYGDHIKSRCSELDNTSPLYLHSIIRDGDNSELVRARTLWEKTE